MIRSADDLLAQLWETQGTDLLLSAGRPPMVRIDGALRPLPGAVDLVPGEAQRLVEDLLSSEQRDALGAGDEVDFSFGWRDVARLRGNAFVAMGEVRCALRLIPSEIPTMADLGLPPAVGRFTQLRQGLVLVTGPTGSGKSTTLASMVDHISATRACHVVTIEDPIEYVYAPRLAVVHQREVGTDTASFAQALRAALREDPDVLLVGEMRDLESIASALTLAETGHLVLATLHTNDTAQALDRLVDVFPADRQAQIRVQLANALTGIVHQRLLPRTGGGMVAAHEVLVATAPVRNLITEGKTNQIRNVVSTHQSEGMQTLEASLSRLVASGAVDHQQAQLVSLHPRDVQAPAVPAPGGLSRGRRGR